MLIRSTFVAGVSTLLGILPFLLLLAVNKCPKSCQTPALVLGYVFVSLYAALCVTVVCIFLASVTLADALKWFTSGLLGLVSSLLLTPVFVTLASLLLLSRHQITADELCHWYCEGLAFQLGPLHISIALADQRRLLRQMPSAGKNLTVRCQVVGMPQTVLLERSSETEEAVQRFSGGELSLTDKQWLQISILGERAGSYVELGFVCLEMSTLLSGGFQGRLKLKSMRRWLDAHIDANIPEPVATLAGSHEADAVDLCVTTESDDNRETQRDVNPFCHPHVHEDDAMQTIAI